MLPCVPPDAPLEIVVDMAVLLPPPNMKRDHWAESVLAMVLTCIMLSGRVYPSGLTSSFVLIMMPTSFTQKRSSMLQACTR